MLLDGQRQSAALVGAAIAAPFGVGAVLAAVARVRLLRLGCATAILATVAGFVSLETLVVPAWVAAPLGPLAFGILISGYVNITAFAFVAVFLGILSGSLLPSNWITGIVCASAAVLALFLVPRLRDQELGPVQPHVSSHKRLRLAKVGLASFWFVAALLLLAASSMSSRSLVMWLSTGAVTGCLAVGWFSGQRVELALPPIGALGVAAFSAVLWTSDLAPVWIVPLGLFAALSLIPLMAFFLQNCLPSTRAREVATSQVWSALAALFACAAAWLITNWLGYPPRRLVGVVFLVSFAGSAYLLTLVPEFLIRFVLWMLTHSIYHIRIVGQENVPPRGPALLVSNHISMADGLLVGASTQRFVRFLVYRPYYERKAFHWLFERMNAIPIAGGDPVEVTRSIERARKELKEGHVVCIFAEGSVSRTGNLLRFKRGFERIVEGLDVPIVPLHLDRLWGSIFSFKEGQFFWKWPRKIPYPVTVSIGTPLASTTKAHEVRLAVQELGSEAVRLRATKRDLLHLRFIETARRRWFGFCMAGASGKHMTYGRALIEALVIARWIRTNCQTEGMLGVLLTASMDAALANLAITLAGKSAINLNPAAGSEIVHPVEQCGIRTILTSRDLSPKAKLDPTPRTVFVENIRQEARLLDRLAAAFCALLLPACMYSGRDKTPDSLATVVFSGDKGVMLSHYNILSNIESMAQVFWVLDSDRILGLLPFHEAFGLTVTLWLPLITGCGVVYDTNAPHATIVVATPAFYESGVSRWPAEHFSSLLYALVGAGQLPEPLARAFQEKFGVELLEGYGITEMAPVVSVNIPDVRRGREYQTGRKLGTVGHALPGVAAKVVDRGTWKTLLPNKEGLLLVKGPNLMIGYLGRPDLTAEALHEGWFITGETASIDEDGFIQIARC